MIDETLLESVDVTKGLKEGGRILINTKAKADRFPFREKFQETTLSATEIALEELGQPIANTVMLGAFAAVDDLVGIEAMLKAVDKGMPENLRAKNKKAIERAHRVIREGK